MFLVRTEYEVLYGGAAGGGKSYATLMAAAQFLDVPGYAALILRRTYSDLSLPGALMQIAREWWGGTEARWVEDDKTWYFPTSDPNRPSSITFGYIEHENDKYRYQGSMYQFVGFDELTQFTESAYTYLRSRTRRTVEQLKMGVMVRMRSASNPGGIGHQWVKERFIDLKEWTNPDGERIPFVIDEDGDAIEAPLFIPAKLTDNPKLDQKEYRKSLKGLDPVMREQLLNGDWNISAGGAQFAREYFKPIVSMSRWDVVRLVRSWDLAATKPVTGQKKDPDWTAGALVAVLANEDIILVDMEREQMRPGDVRTLVYTTALADRELADALDVEIEIAMEQEPGASGKEVAERYKYETLSDFWFFPMTSSGSKELKAVPLANKAQEGKVYYLTTCKHMRDFLDEAELFPHGTHDDMVDAFAGAIRHINKGKPISRATQPVRNSFAWR